MYFDITLRLDSFSFRLWFFIFPMTNIIKFNSLIPLRNLKLKVSLFFLSTFEVDFTPILILQMVIHIQERGSCNLLWAFFALNPFQNLYSLLDLAFARLLLKMINI